MKRVLVFLSIIATSFSVFAQENKIDSKLRAAMNSASDSEFLGVIIELREQPKLSTDLKNRADVLQYLLDFANSHQDSIRNLLTVNQSLGNVEEFRSYYIFNGLYAKCRKRVIESLSRFAAVSKIYLDEYTFVLGDENIVSEESPTLFRTSSSNYWWNIKKIGAERVRENLQIDGTGVLVGVIDTGFSNAHPDLSPRWKSQYGWKDFVNGNPTPYDDYGHGTGVTGIIVAGDNSGDNIGVAPGAQFIAAKPLDSGGGATKSNLLLAMQWMMDPDEDGNPNTGQQHVPDVVNNSWGWPSTTDTTWWSAVNSWVAAGIFPVFIAHNDGPNPSTVRVPGGYPQSFCVGAVDSFDVIRSYSGRGPITWDSIQYIRPDVVAPSEPYIKFCGSPDSYFIASGATSTSGPHVAGIVALIKQAAPSLSISDIKTVIETGAKDRGASGKDNDYGSGRIDVYQSVLHAYAYSNKSVSSTATASNNGRRLVKDSSGKYHLVFESGIPSGGQVLSEIFYRNSTDGVNWTTPVRLSTGNEQNRYPSIAERGGNIYVVWQQLSGSTYHVDFYKSPNGDENFA